MIVVFSLVCAVGHKPLWHGRWGMGRQGAEGGAGRVPPRAETWGPTSLPTPACPGGFPEGSGLELRPGGTGRTPRTVPQGLLGTCGDLGASLALGPPWTFPCGHSVGVQGACPERAQTGLEGWSPLAQAWLPPCPEPAVWQRLSCRVWMVLALGCRVGVIKGPTEASGLWRGQGSSPVGQGGAQSLKPTSSPVMAWSSGSRIWRRGRRTHGQTWCEGWKALGFES